MGRYTGPSCRLCRRAGEKLFLKGDKCVTPRCPLEKRRSPPGDISRRRRRPSDYAVHLLEKQKAKYIYGVLEGQFRRYMADAFNTPGVSGLNLLRTLERRLDNVVYQLGFSDSRKQGRQIVLHGHFRVNGVKTDVPSFLVSPGDVISWKESDKGTEFYAERIDGIPKRPVPAWLSLDQSEMTGTVVSLPSDDDVRSIVDSRLIVEFYSR
ncbi:MAG: 30S ribosomal protein S4 [SAR202 cluster bacterium]|nr:30S ribosomal protein S4 [Chloroflexota bacterium]MQF94701.1 30S ribosomal protein S4 [SAR202 cluster bacterium]HAA94897.1 30S ribosomal protein S4 [Dehalococcoidia bacterium]MBO19673.1 30S ribosomal protein S4 [Chloroflexota bacterium]MQG34099.1 30S ribosomal protein S4 [SAR202 cluster bacterium]